MDGDVEDFGGRLDEFGDGCGPVAVEGDEALLDLGFWRSGPLFLTIERCGGGAPPDGARAFRGHGVEVAEEAVLAEDEVDALVGARSDTGVEAGAEATGGEQAGVYGFWGFGHDGLADLGADAVGADDEVAFDAGAVGEVGEDGLVGQVFDGDEAFVVVDGDALGFGLLDEHAVEGGAGDHDSGLAVAAGISGALASEELSELVFKGPFVSGDTGVADLLDDAGGGEDVHAVGSEAEGAAGFAGAVGGFEDVDAEAGLLEEEGEDGAGDSTADDEGAFLVCHKLRNLSFANYLNNRDNDKINDMTDSRKRQELVRQVGLEVGREIGARTILFHQAIANMVGVSVTDMKCLDYVDRGGDVTAGDLARLTGLTTGAITAAIDRLEKGGLARRERSETDRRKVFIRIAASPATEKLGPIFDELGKEVSALATRYSTKELETIKDFCDRSIEIMRRQTEKVMALEKK